MPRNLDMTALRAFVTVADAGGVTRAAGLLNLTQSAVSMQLKRLEEALGQPLLDRSARQITLTAPGEQLLSYGRRLLSLSDEVFARFTDQAYEGELVLGVPADIVYPHIPQVLQRFAAEYPRVRVLLQSSCTSELKAQFARGEVDVILTTEDHCDPGGETLARRKLLWFGAPGGTAWKVRPLPLAFERHCIFRPGVQRALDAAGIPWEMAVESDGLRAVEVSVAADLGVQVCVAGTEPPHAHPRDEIRRHLRRHAGPHPPRGQARGLEVANGYDVIVIVSAMAGKTNELVGWVEETSPLFDAREYDAVVSSGENVTAGLMALTLQEMDVPARSWQGWQVPVQTTSAHASARIEAIPPDNIMAKFAEGMRVAVVAGFQGISPEGRITTLGRGGSDTTAVAFAAAFGAERCDIYTDVDGVYTTDPRITRRPASSTRSRSRRCWNWPRWAPRCCRPGRWNWRCATA
jgi:DNA-binding transcriptional LysR family regulator